ncbi:hypothetical protein DV735_g5042, partial [Chaetothyriales sp. CBS 134920]
MLRRAPTALTLSPADLLDFEKLHALYVAHAEYLRTGEDVQRMFTGYTDAQIRSKGFIRRLATAEVERRVLAEQQQHNYSQNQPLTAAAVAGRAALTDPNDELKPLPGDKARIVRAREERIMGR